MSIASSVRFFLAVLTFSVMTESLHARPWWVTMDSSDPDHLPEKYGYNPKARKTKESVRFTVYLDQAAWGALRQSRVHNIKSSKGFLSIEVIKNRDQRTLEFSMPQAKVADSYLYLGSAPLAGDPPMHKLNNFFGYRLSIGPEHDSDFGVNALLPVPSIAAPCDPSGILESNAGAA